MQTSAGKTILHKQCVFFGAAVCLLLVLIAASRHIKLWESDLFMHLAIGKLGAGAAFPKGDPFSYTRPTAEWIAHEWLFAAAISGIQRFAGWHALSILRDVLISVSFIPVLLTLRLFGAGRWQALAIAAGISGVAAFSVELRPHVITFLFLPLALYVVYRAWYGRPGLLPLLTLVIPLWVNMHAGMVAFFLSCAVLVVGFVAQRLLRRDARAPHAQLVLWIPAALLLTFINPFGLRIWLLPWIAMRERFSELVGEWQRAELHYAAPTLAVFLVCAGLIAGRWRRVHAAAALLFLFWAAMAFITKRNIALFAYAGMPLVALALKHYPARTASLAAVGILALGLMQYAVFDRYMDRRLARHWGGGVDFAQTPYACAQFVKQHLPARRLFNDYNTGGYLIYWLYPDYRVAIDGRIDVYGREYFLEHHSVMLGQNWEEVFSPGRRNVNTVFVSYAYAFEPRSLITELDSSPEWSLVFWDDRAMVYVRDSTNSAIAERFRYPAVRPAQPPAHFIHGLDDARAVLNDVERKLAEDPGCRRAKWLKQQCELILQNASRQ